MFKIASFIGIILACSLVALPQIISAHRTLSSEILTARAQDNVKKISFDVCDDVVSVVCCDKIDLTHKVCNFTVEVPTKVLIANVDKKEHKVENEKEEITLKQKKSFVLHKYTPPNNMLLDIGTGEYCVCPSNKPAETVVNVANATTVIPVGNATVVSEKKGGEENVAVEEKKGDDSN